MPTPTSSSPARDNQNSASSTRLASARKKWRMDLSQGGKNPAPSKDEPASDHRKRHTETRARLTAAFRSSTENGLRMTGDSQRDSAES